ncbi:MAG TPA: hypothetical protein VKH37_02145, partial [Ferruginibacter sp.]|nr:hypothetical protein [Ferruginibacter sp.]
MKKLLLLSAIALSITATSFGQFYLQGGVNFANITTTNDGQTEKNHVLTTFNAGFMGRFGLSK